MPHQIDKTALVMHSAERMFHLVNDVARYPEFLPWCAGAEVHEQNDAEIMASLDISKGGVRHRLTTRNQLLMLMLVCLASQFLDDDYPCTARTYARIPLHTTFTNVESS